MENSEDSIKKERDFDYELKTVREQLFLRIRETENVKLQYDNHMKTLQEQMNHLLQTEQNILNDQEKANQVV